ncbi:MAG: response regulator [Chloroflexota bacterium]
MSPQKPCALIIEDQINLSIVYSLAVERSGYEVVQALNGADALSMLRTFKPALVLLDLELPFVDGETVLKEIHSMPELKETRIILATANARLADFLQDQVDSVLIKPILYNQLFHMISRIRTAESSDFKPTSPLSNVESQSGMGDQALN